MKSKSKSKSNFKSKKYLKKKNSSRNSRTKINKKTKRKQIGSGCGYPLLISDTDFNKLDINELKIRYDSCCPIQKSKYFGTTKNKAPFCQKINNRLEQQTKKKILDNLNTFDSNYNERPTSTTERPTDLSERPTDLSEISYRPNSFNENQ